MVVASRKLYEFVPATEKWKVVADLARGTNITGLAYHAKDDTLYGLGDELGGDDGGRPVLYQFNPQGALLKSTELADPMFPGLLGRLSPQSRVQLVSVDDRLAAVVGGTPPRDESGRQMKAESFLYLIDPKSNKVVLGWKE